MKPLRCRQVHLDFHTSECVPSVGDRFDKEQFKAALKLGHVDSITVFSKCHHGWAYHPSKANETHPKLKFDLLAAELEACKEAGVNAPVYLSAGFDEKYARRHPEHLNKNTSNAGADFLNGAHYHLLCYNTPYLDVLMAQVEEVMQRYNPTGIFLDISAPRICYCQHCLESMREKGLDPRNPADVKEHGMMVYAEYCRRTEEVVRRYNPDTTIFHNAGNITRGRRDHAHFDTHLELESLPTGGWGYDHFPMSAAYCRTLGMEYLGMTGKFHTSWGEFGGFKHPNALRYEVALSIAEGAKCSIGDQLHPTGEMNLSTYSLIGKAYAEVEAKEPYVRGAKQITDIAVLSAEAFSNHPDRSCPFDVGASRILLEGKYLFNLVDQYEDVTPYKLLILPDVIRVDDTLKARLENYLAGGGRILCTGESGLKPNADEFALDLGVVCEGTNEYTPSYMIPEFDTVNGRTAYVMYTQAKNVKVTNGSVEALLEDTYFNRAPQHFCSHKHTPNNPGADRPGAVLTKNTGYIAWNLFQDYATIGSYHLKELALHMISALLTDGEKSIAVNLPDRGIVTLTKQEEESRYVAHLLFAHTTKRGNGVEVIEDIVPLYDIRMTAALPCAPRRVYKAEYADGKMIETGLPFTYENGSVTVEVGKVDMHAMVVLDV
ncbi:MAG: alpha-L-fucosidase [Clostridia bacterium]|nr:alpha-L-fucosidase [Clostridia bacterium]